MYYVYCGAYGHLLFALYLKNIGKKIIIITHYKNIVKFCEMENIPYIKFNKILLNGQKFYKIFTFKKNLDRLIDRIDFKPTDTFLLTGDRKIIDAFYLAKDLIKKGRVYYYFPSMIKKNIYKPSRLKPIFIRGGILKVILKTFMDLDLMYYQGHGLPIIGIDEFFLKKHNISEYKIDLTPREILLYVAKNNQINYSELDNLIIHEGDIGRFIKEASLKKTFYYLLNLSEKFAFKPHPSSRDTSSHFKKLINECENVPEYIPVELLFNNIRKNVISIFSISLITASKFKHLNSISLLELVDWCDTSHKKEIKTKLMKKSRNKILFPKNLDELKNILLEKHISH